MVDEVYFDPVERRYYFGGKLTTEVIEALRGEFGTLVSNVFITNILSAQKGYIAELTVDQLDTSKKVQLYLDSDTSDDNYVRIADKSIELVTASTDGLTTEQVTDRSGASLYWTDDTHVEITTEETEFPVLIYVYTELVKWKLSFELIDDVYVPIMTVGAGEGEGDNEKFFLFKGPDGPVQRYVTTDGEITDLRWSNFIDGKFRRVETCEIDKTAGEITLKMEGVEDPEIITFAETATGITYTRPDSFTTTVSIA
jgi:hypothetical protein